MTIEEMLTTLKELDARLELAKIDKKRAELKVIPAEVKQQLDDIAVEFDEIIEGISQAIKSLEGEIKDATMQQGQTVKSHYTAVWVSGRVKWDNKGLSKYAQDHPEIERWKTIGQPSVRILRKPFF